MYGGTYIQHTDTQTLIIEIAAVFNEFDVSAGDTLACLMYTFACFGDKWQNFGINVIWIFRMYHKMIMLTTCCSCYYLLFHCRLRVGSGVLAEKCRNVV